MQQTITRTTSCNRCGNTIGFCQSIRTGKFYPVEILGPSPDGFLVDTTGFHKCPEGATPPKPVERVKLTGALSFLEAAANRSSAKVMRTKLLTEGRKLVQLGWKADRDYIYVTDGRPYGESSYFGKISRQTGIFFDGRDHTPEVTKTLLKLDGDPVAAAVAYGKATGECCFCGKALDDQRSTTIGYGPTCAKKFALPWGEVGVATPVRSRQTLEAAQN